MQNNGLFKRLRPASGHETLNATTATRAAMSAPFRHPRTRDALDQLTAQLSPSQVALGDDIRTQHANAVTGIAAERPDAVVFAESTADVVAVVTSCARHGVPVVAFGAGTSLEGHVNATNGGISLDMSRMADILAVRTEDLDCVVQPGLSRGALNRELRDTGLFFSVDPGADTASLGGMAATRASGTTSVRYGTMRDNVLSLEAVMADGRVVRTARRARKSSAGYDLTHLLVGSEGTLGIITELTLRLHGQPETILAAVCPFPSVAAACNAVIAAIQLNIGVARIELLDALQVRGCNQYSGLSLEEAPTLFLEFHGTPVSAPDMVTRFEEIASNEGALRFDWAETTEDRSRLWKARHDAYWAGRSLRPGADALATDVCVPISRLAECVAATQEDIAAHGLIAPIVGHVGDGNFHVLPLFDASDGHEVAKVQAFMARLVERALAMDGTCTGEHGIGTGKKKYMAAEHGEGVEVMASIKRALDPQNILNPGKIIEL